MFNKIDFGKLKLIIVVPADTPGNVIAPEILTGIVIRQSFYNIRSCINTTMQLKKIVSGPS